MKVAKFTPRARIQNHFVISTSYVDDAYRLTRGIECEIIGFQRLFFEFCECDE